MIQYGVPSNIPTLSQRMGHAGRKNQPTIYLLMYEEWVTQIDISQVTKDPDEPDQPWQPLPRSNTKQRSRISKRNRAAISVLELVLSSLGFPKPCIW